MTITYDLDLNSFNAWSGAVDTLDRIRQFGYYTVREWKIIDNVLKITIRTQF